MKKLIPFSLILAALIASLLIFKPANAQNSNLPLQQDDEVLCGNGSASDDYGFRYDLMQYHWTVDWEDYLSEETVDEIDVILDELNYDNIAQTMILIKPADDVGNRVNCAVHFLRYMQLGQPDGQRKDNGFTFLVVMDNNKIDVHYGVGLGLPALTAHNLTELNRLAEETYKETESLDEALLALVYGFDEYAREKYDPYYYPTPTASAAASTQSAGLSVVAICLICVVILIIMVVFAIIAKTLNRLGSRSRTTRWGSSGGSSRWSGGSGSYRPRSSSSWSSSRPSSSWRPSSSSSSSRPKSRPSRGGSGSGRSHRGN